MLVRVVDGLWGLSETNGWNNRCNSLSEASAKMRLQPRSIVVPYDLVEKVSGLSRSDADRLMSAQGYIASGEQQVLVADLPPGHALVAAAPTLLGFYTRVDDRLGLMLTRIDESVFLIRGESA